MIFDYDRIEIPKSLRKFFGLRGDLASRAETVVQPTLNVGTLDRAPFHSFLGFAGGAVRAASAGNLSVIGISNTSPFLLVIEAITVMCPATVGFRVKAAGNGIAPSVFGFPNFAGTWDVNEFPPRTQLQFGGALHAASPAASAILYEGLGQGSSPIPIPGYWNMDPGGAQFGGGVADFGQTLWIETVALNNDLRVNMWGRFWDPANNGIGR